MKIYVVVDYYCDRESDPGCAVLGTFSSVKLAKQMIRDMIARNYEVDDFVYKNRQYYSEDLSMCIEIVKTKLDK